MPDMDLHPSTLFYPEVSCSGSYWVKPRQQKLATWIICLSFILTVCNFLHRYMNAEKSCFTHSEHNCKMYYCWKDHQYQQYFVFCTHGLFGFTAKFIQISEDVVPLTACEIILSFHGGNVLELYFIFTPSFEVR